MPVVDLVELPRPEANLDLSRQAAELILEIGNYKATRDIGMVLDEMVSRTTVVALDGYEQVIGTAGLRIVAAGLGTLEDVVSDPRKRGLGIGRKVVGAVEDLALREGVLQLNLGSSLSAMSFYSHLGYEKLGERTFRKYL